MIKAIMTMVILDILIIQHQNHCHPFLHQGHHEYNQRRRHLDPNDQNHCCPAPHHDLVGHFDHHPDHDDEGDHQQDEMNDQVKGRSRAVPLSDANIDASDGILIIQGPKPTDHDHDGDDDDDDDDGDDDDTRMQDNGIATASHAMPTSIEDPL